MLLDRTAVEEGEEVIDAAKTKKVAFVTAGDTMAATTHVDIRLRAMEENDADQAHPRRIDIHRLRLLLRTAAVQVRQDDHVAVPGGELPADQPLREHIGEQEEGIALPGSAGHPGRHQEVHDRGRRGPLAARCGAEDRRRADHGQTPSSAPLPGSDRGPRGWSPVTPRR